MAEERELILKLREKDYRPYSVQAWYGEAHGKRSGILGPCRCGYR